MTKQVYKCLNCGRDNFDRPNQPHWCKGNFRKHKQACIPVEPEPTCTDCGHPVSEHEESGCLVDIPKGHPRRGSLGMCNCGKTPADLQPIKPDSRKVEKHCTDPSNQEYCLHLIPSEEVCGDCPRWGQPTPEQMPLIEVIDPMGRNIAHTQSCCCRVCSRLRKQRDADMAWHNEKAQQVRKEFASDVCAYLTSALNIISPSTEEKVQEHIRDMAGK